MRLTIINDDRMVYVDGHAIVIDASHFNDHPVTPDFHALQWFGDEPTPYGWIEYRVVNGQRARENQVITELGSWERFAHAHADAKVLLDQAEKDALAKIEAIKKAKTLDDSANRVMHLE
jgi:hypothetical protein